MPETLSPSKSYRLSVRAFWAKRQRLDGDNLLKAILDGLFKQDRRVTMMDYEALEGHDAERAFVTLTELD